MARATCRICRQPHHRLGRRRPAPRAWPVTEVVGHHLEQIRPALRPVRA